MHRKSWIVTIVGAFLTVGMALAGTFGKVVTIGGQANDLALDEARGVLYVANFTANRIEVMSLASNTIQTSINVPKQPNGISLSPDGHWLLVSHYGNRTSTPSTPATQTNALTSTQLASLTTTTLDLFSVDQIGELSTTQVQGLTTTQLNGINIGGVDVLTVELDSADHMDPFDEIIHAVKATQQGRFSAP